MSRSSASLAHYLSVHLALGGHIDDEIALNGRLTAQAVIVRKPLAALAVARLDFVEGRTGFRGGNGLHAWRSPRPCKQSGSARKVRAPRKPSPRQHQYPGRRRASECQAQNSPRRPDGVKIILALVSATSVVQSFEPARCSRRPSSGSASAPVAALALRPPGRRLAVLSQPVCAVGIVAHHHIGA